MISLKFRHPQKLAGLLYKYVREQGKVNPTKVEEILGVSDSEAIITTGYATKGASTEGEGRIADDADETNSLESGTRFFFYNVMK